LTNVKNREKSFNGFIKRVTHPPPAPVTPSPPLSALSTVTPSLIQFAFGYNKRRLMAVTNVFHLSACVTFYSPPFLRIFHCWKICVSILPSLGIIYANLWYASQQNIKN